MIGDWDYDNDYDYDGVAIHLFHHNHYHNLKSQSYILIKDFTIRSPPSFTSR